jgi:hypothetical protein
MRANSGATSDAADRDRLEKLGLDQYVHKRREEEQRAL